METDMCPWFVSCSDPLAIKLAFSSRKVYCEMTTPKARGTELRALLRLSPTHGHPSGDRGSRARHYGRGRT
jgi:hypothetical protein